MTNNATRILLIAVVLVSINGVVHNSLALPSPQANFDFSVSLGAYSLAVTPSHSGFVPVTVSLVSGATQNVTLTSVVSPPDGELSLSFAQGSGYPPFVTTLIVQALAAPPGKQYAVTVSGIVPGLTRTAPVLTVTINCTTGPCPQPHVDWTDKAAYAQGESIQFRGSQFVPGDAVASCLTTDNNVTAICRNQGTADSQGRDAGSMTVTPNIPIGPQQFYLKDLTNGQQSQNVQLTIVTTGAGLTTTVVGDGTITPSCPSGCQEPIGQAMNIVASPAPGWSFSGWSITGASCSNGAASTPCTFTMPNNPVSVTANFLQYQTLSTSFVGQGALSPSCPSGCQIAVGSTVSIVATPAPGWAVSGYTLTNGLSCGSQTGYACTFQMPGFPVNFQVTFTETTSTIQITVVVPSTMTTSVTRTSVVGNIATSTIVTSTQATTQMSGVVTAVVTSTTVSNASQTQANILTSFTTLSTSVTSVATNVENPVLELSLAAIILLSVAMIAIGAIRRSPRRATIMCPHCGVKNSSTKYCVSCGEPLKRP